MADTSLLKRQLAALTSDNASTRLRAALAIGTTPVPALLETLIARCAVESDFYVRDMLTWALTRYAAELAVPLLLQELESDVPQARSQALHTLSKIKDRRAWSALTRALLHDADDEVARSAWRAAVILVPVGEESELAAELVTQLGRGNRDLQLSLSRALVALGQTAVEPALQNAHAEGCAAVQAHAAATLRLLHDPDAGFELSIDQARRIYVLGKP